MKKTTICFLILSCFTICYGQKDSTKTNFKRFQVGVSFSPNACYRKLTDANGVYGISNVINTRNKTEIMKFGYTTGLSFCYNFKRWLGIEAGVQYNNQGYQTRKHIDVYSPTSTDYINNTASKSHVVYTFNYIDIPVKVNFTIGHKKVRFFSSVGLSANFLLRAKSTATIEYDNNKQPNKVFTSIDKEFRKFSLSPFASVGIDYQIKDFLTLRIAPTFRYGVLSIVNAPINGYLWNVGCNVACYFNF